MWTCRCVRDEVGHANKVSGGGIDEGLEPGVGSIILNLNNVGKDSSVVLLDELRTRQISHYTNCDRNVNAKDVRIRDRRSHRCICRRALPRPR
jgi:hypothetical protein